MKVFKVFVEKDGKSVLLYDSEHDAEKEDKKEDA